MNFKDLLKNALKRYTKEDIIITDHAITQAMFRNIDIEGVRENIINPKRLVYAEKQKAKRENEEKYNCYFGYSSTKCHRYVLVINAKCIVCTIIKINRRWQHTFEKNAKI